MMAFPRADSRLLKGHLTDAQKTYSLHGIRNFRVSKTSYDGTYLPDTLLEYMSKNAPISIIGSFWSKLIVDVGTTTPC